MGLHVGVEAQRRAARNPDATEGADVAPRRRPRVRAVPPPTLLHSCEVRTAAAAAAAARLARSSHPLENPRLSRTPATPAAWCGGPNKKAKLRVRDRSSLLASLRVHTSVLRASFGWCGAAVLRGRRNILLGPAGALDCRRASH